MGPNGELTVGLSKDTYRPAGGKVDVSELGFARRKTFKYECSNRVRKNHKRFKSVVQQTKSQLPEHILCYIRIAKDAKKVSDMEEKCCYWFDEAGKCYVLLAIPETKIYSLKEEVSLCPIPNTPERFFKCICRTLGTITCLLPLYNIGKCACKTVSEINCADVCGNFLWYKNCKSGCADCWTDDRGEIDYLCICKGACEALECDGVDTN